MTTPIPVADLRDAIARYRSGALDALRLGALFRPAAAAWPGLPARFHPALDGLLMQIESSGLFQEESCSFSVNDLANALTHWLDRAEAVAPLSPAGD